MRKSAPPRVEPPPLPLSEPSGSSQCDPPCIRGLRITVDEVLDYLASGMSPEEILQDFPDLKMQDIKACLAFAAARERKISIVPA